MGAHHALNLHGLVHRLVSSLIFIILTLHRARSLAGGRLGSFRPEFALKEPQAQGVGHHRHRAEAHSCGGKHGVELPVQSVVEHASRQGNAQGVVEKRPEQVLLNIADGGPGQLHSGGHVQQVRFHQHNVRALNGHVGTGPDGQPHLRPGQGGGVVDAVAHHGHLFALLLEGGDLPFLVLGQHLGHHLGNPQLLANGVGSALIVPGEHDHLQPQFPERGHRAPAGGLGGVGHSDDAQ